MFPLVVDKIIMILMESEFGAVDFKTRNCRHIQAISFSYESKNSFVSFDDLRVGWLS